MEARLAEHDTRMATCTQEVTAVTARIQTAELKLEAMVNIQDQFKEFQTCAACTMVDIGKQVEILSNANRVANVRVLGFPPVSENVDLRPSVEEFFKTVVFGDAADVRGDVKRVTRLATKGPDPAASVRGTVLAVLRVADDRDSLLRAASRKEDIFFQGARILLFPDFCKETAMRRAALQKVRLSLIQRGATATVANPAKLKVTYKDKSYVFTEPFMGTEHFGPVPQTANS